MSLPTLHGDQCGPVQNTGQGVHSASQQTFSPERLSVKNRPLLWVLYRAGLVILQKHLLLTGRILGEAFKEDNTFLLTHSKDFLTIQWYAEGCVFYLICTVCAAMSGLRSSVSSPLSWHSLVIAHLLPKQHLLSSPTSSPAEVQGFLIIKLQRVQIGYQTIGTNCLKRFTSISVRLMAFQTRHKMNK